MVMRAVVAAVALLPGAALADEPTSVRDGEKPLLLRETDETMLHLDLVALPSTAGLGAKAEVDERTTIAIGRHTWVELEGTRWSNELDVRERGWTAGARLAHDFGPFFVGIGAELHSMDRRYSSGSYYDVGLTIGRSKKLSRWMTAWIALSIGRRMWLGDKPPVGEDNGEQVMLSVGTTFR
ncbi:hypothetical protein BH11MYX3_BH11MYX3_13590 [soil metagenome]